MNWNSNVDKLACVKSSTKVMLVFSYNEKSTSWEGFEGDDISLDDYSSRVHLKNCCRKRDIQDRNPGTLLENKQWRMGGGGTYAKNKKI